MYEILLGSKGIMQLGWATLSCNFTNEVKYQKVIGLDITGTWGTKAIMEYWSVLDTKRPFDVY